MTLSSNEIQAFQENLLTWFSLYRRDLPWRRTTDPYAIWISEIMLQQTRVAAVIPFYARFLSRFPDFGSLAAAPESDLLAHWAGLGYYYRARNLQKAAQLMVASGAFPSDHADIHRLPGVGEYTSAAVASIAFNLPHAAVDGNVLRVLSRVFADPVDISSEKGKKHFTGIAESILERSQPGTFNQATMELGATICFPKNPHCLVCPISGLCQARLSGRQSQFPAKLSKMKSVEEERILLWVENSRGLLLWQRPADSRLMPGFWELPEPKQLTTATLGEELGSFRYAITFHNYRFRVVESSAPESSHGFAWVAFKDLPSLPLSTVLRKATRLVEKQRKKRQTTIRVAASG